MKKPECPKCGCKKYRNVGEIASIMEVPAAPWRKTKYKRTVVEKVIECMKCDEVYARP